jgi:dihydroorotate dehydrogenase (fumarate)
MAMPDLSTTYLGLRLACPLVPSASPLSRNLDTIRRMEDAGAAAVVLHSLFEEQITFESHVLDRYLTVSADSYWEAVTYYPEPEDFTLPPEQYLEHVRRAKAAVGIPIIGSLNGVSAGGWIKYARLIEEAGADALELNVYFVPTDPHMTGVQIEQTMIDLVREVRRCVRIPLAVKLSPFFSNIAALAHQLVEAGADGLVLFNRFNQPDIDLDVLEVVTRPLVSRTGEGEALRLPLRWIAILHERLNADLAATGGVHSATDALKLLMVGANVTMLASELLVNGVDRLRAIRADLEAWLVEREYDSVQQLRGSMSQQRVAEPAAFERAHYLRTVGTFTLASTLSINTHARTYGLESRRPIPPPD